MAISIRPYAAADLRAVLEIWDSAIGRAYSFLSATYLQQERRNIARQYLPDSTTWIAEFNGRAQGFICLQGIEVAGLFVAAAAQRCGLGRALLTHALSRHGMLELEVFSANSAGRAFYQRCGFEPLYERLHEDSGQLVLRLHLSENRAMRVGALALPECEPGPGGGTRSGAPLPEVAIGSPRGSRSAGSPTSGP